MAPARSLSRTLARGREALHLIARLASDAATRRALAGIYASLGDPAQYGRLVPLRLTIGGRARPVTIRVGDIFVLAEIFHERQYRLRSQVPQDAVVIDAGANIGLSALWFLGDLPNATLHAFEPEPSNVALLRQNLAEFSRATVVPAAVGRLAGAIDLHIGDSTATHSILAGAPDHGAAVTVPMVTLGDHLKGAGVTGVDLLKLDVEGAELDALIGLGDRIGGVRVIIGEMHEALVSETDFYAFLKAAGFDLVAKTRFAETDTLGVHGFEAARP